MKNNKKMLGAVAALAAAILLLAGVYFITRPATTGEKKDISIVIVYQDGTEKNIQCTTTAEYLIEVLLEKELVSGYDSVEYGYTIVSVDGIALDWERDKAYWALYVGDSYATAGASFIPLEDGGVYRIVYEAF